MMCILHAARVRCCTLMFAKLVLLKRLHRHVKVVKRNLCFFGAWQLKATFTNVISLLPS